MMTEQVPDRAEAVADPDVLLRNTRSPRRFGHGFQRNAVSQAFELADQPFRDALAVFAS
jgi:hypothetical protein